MVKPLFRYFFIIGTLGLFAYGLITLVQKKDNFFTRHVIQEQAEAKKRLSITELNYLIPSFSDLVAFNRTFVSLPDDRWRAYVAYFEKIAQLMPSRPDVYLFLGYCYFYQGLSEKAYAAFKSSLTLDEQSFWAYYNLSLMAAKSGDAQAASTGFYRASQIAPQVVLSQMLQSKLYIDLLSVSAGLPALIEENLNKAYVIAHRLGAMAVQAEQGDAKARAMMQETAKLIQIQVF